MDRRDFLKAALSALGFSALPDGLLFAAPEGWKHGGKPNLVFGVLSDTHLRTTNRGNRLGANWTDRYLVTALTYFKSRNVDAVAICGDMAHRGQIQEMVFHARAWRKVFAEGSAPVKLFVTGNHDTDGANYGSFVSKRYPDPVEKAKRVLSTDMAGNWKRIWGEKYEPVWHKEVKGYHFIGQHYSVPDHEAVEHLKRYGRQFALNEGSKPFFFMRHRRPYSVLRKKGLLPLRNSVTFFGHNHQSVSNWNVVSLYYGCLPVLQCASCEPRGTLGLTGDAYIAKAAIERHADVCKARQGYLVLVYDDMIVFERHEFTNGESSLGADWVMPIFGDKGSGTAKPAGKEARRAHPLAKTELKKAVGSPQFRKGAVLGISDGATSSLSRISPASDPSKQIPSLTLTIPPADGNPKSRVYAYEAVVIGNEGGRKLFKAVYAAGVNAGVGHEPNGGVTTLVVPKSELPSGDQLTLAVRPLSSLGTFGKPIFAKFTITI